jgi:hypothetical protein
MSTILAFLMTLYCFIILLALWLAVDSTQHRLRRMVDLIRKQRNEDLRWHRDSLLAYMRSEQATRR